MAAAPKKPVSASLRGVLLKERVFIFGETEIAYGVIKTEPEITLKPMDL
jgi:hypothetical protein